MKQGEKEIKEYAFLLKLEAEGEIDRGTEDKRFYLGIINAVNKIMLYDTSKQK